MTPLSSKSLRRWGASWFGLLLVWLALVGSHDPLELAVGAGAALVGAIALATVRTSGGFPSFVFRRRTWSRAATGLARIAPDLRLLAVGVGAPGALSTTRLPDGTDWRHRAERGLVELFGSLAPNTLVFDASSSGTARAHELVETNRSALR